MKIVFGTGHRPEKAGRVFDDMVELSKDELRIQDPKIAICGMAAGFDLAYGRAAMELEIPLWCARPWAGHQARRDDRHIYAALIDYAARVVNVHGSPDPKLPHRGVYQDRNEWMVDQASSGIAWWNGESGGGTWNCLQYAEDMNKPVVNIYPGMRKSL